MEAIAFASVIAEVDTTRCVSATATVHHGAPGLCVTGVTDRAAREIGGLVLAAMRKRGLNLPGRAIIVDLTFDVPFESTSELTFATFCALASASEIMWSADISDSQLGHFVSAGYRQERNDHSA